jgi:hypothetical protein
VVAAALDREAQVVLACDVHARHHVGNPGTPEDGHRIAVDHRVPDGPGVVVAGVAGVQQVTTGAVTERLDRGACSGHGR